MPLLPRYSCLLALAHDKAGQGGDKGAEKGANMTPQEAGAGVGQTSGQEAGISPVGPPVIG